MSAFDIALAAWLVLSAPVSFLAGMFVSAQNVEAWIENPGVCPVPPEMKIDASFPDMVIKDVMAGELMWDKNPLLLGKKSTIQHWRIAQ